MNSASDYMERFKEELKAEAGARRMANVMSVPPPMMMSPGGLYERHSSPFISRTSPPPQPDATKQFGLIKKSLKKIKAEPFNGEVRKRIENKINKLQKVGATNQALILEVEITTRDSLMRLQEWDYKLLPKAEIGKFQKENTVTMTRDGLELHIDPLETYIGNPKTGEAKDRIIPDDVLEKLETAKERELFDSFAILWAEKVKDPLVLGCVNGCEDYFFIAEWGTDITFEQITKGKP